MPLYNGPFGTQKIVENVRSDNCECGDSFIQIDQLFNLVKLEYLVHYELKCLP